MAGQQCDVTIKTRVDQFRELLGAEGKRYTVDLKAKWTSVLRKYGVDPAIHYLKNSDGKHSVSLHDRVDDFTKQFSQVRQNYVVYIHKMDKAGQLKARQLEQGNKKPVTKQHIVKPPSPVKQQKRGRKRTAQNVDMNGGGQYEEDEFIIPNTAQQFNGFGFDDAGPSAGVANQNHIYDYENEDAMSQDSQDSQDEGPDIKAQIVNKLVKVVSNGDMYRIQNELKKLKNENKFIKASRYLPFSLNILQNIFLE